VELPLQPKIYLGSTETAQHVAPEIPRLSGRRCRKRRAIENFPARILRPKKLKRHSWDNVCKRQTKYTVEKCPVSFDTIWPSVANSDSVTKWRLPDLVFRILPDVFAGMVDYAVFALISLGTADA
jgi:hypothetical protein